MLGVSCFKSKKQVGFWSSSFPVKIAADKIQSYNRAVGKLWIGYGSVLCLLGLPLLTGQNSPWALVTILGIVFATIGLLLIYTSIETKYTKR